MTSAPKSVCTLDAVSHTPCCHSKRLAASTPCFSPMDCNNLFRLGGTAGSCQTALPQRPRRAWSNCPSAEPARSCFAAFSPASSEQESHGPHQSTKRLHHRQGSCKEESTGHKTHERFCSRWLLGSTARGRLDPRPLHEWVEPWHYGTP